MTIETENRADISPNDYFNDPDIIDEPIPLRSVHAIRLMLNDELNGMLPEERAALINERTEAVMKEFGLDRLSVELLKTAQTLEERYKESLDPKTVKLLNKDVVKDLRQKSSQIT